MSPTTAPRRLIGRIAVLGAGAVVPVLLLALWVISARVGWLTEQILPDPRDVLQTARDYAASGELLADTAISLRRVAEGFAIGAALGLVIGAAQGLSQGARAILELPFFVISQVPVLGWLPLLILLVGIDEELKVIVIAWSAFVPVALNTAQGMRDVPRTLREVGQVLTFDPWSMLSRIIVPAAVPSIFTGLREGLAHSWQTLVAVELFASSEGLGYLMSWGRQLFQLDIVVMALVVVGAIGLALNWTLGRVERRLRRWQVQTG